MSPARRRAPLGDNSPVASPPRDPPVRSATSHRLAEVLDRLLAAVDEALAGSREEIDRLEVENAALRRRLRELDRQLARAQHARRPAPPRPRAAARAARGRATPPEVTPAVVLAVISKLGSPTAAEIASEISRHGTKVSGRAVRLIAERAGARTQVGADGQRRYRMAG